MCGINECLEEEDAKAGDALWQDLLAAIQAKTKNLKHD